MASAPSTDRDAPPARHLPWPAGISAAAGRDRVQRRARRNVLVAVAAGLAAGLVAGGAGALVVGAGLVHTTASLDDRRSAAPPASTLLVDAAGRPVAIVGDARRRLPVDAAATGRRMREATVAIEDRRFWSHGAIDPRGLARAIVHDLAARRLAEGGSTLTQQLVTVRYLQKADRSLWRKVDELVLAHELASRASRSAILTGYLNDVYYGHGAYGVEAAALTYFGRHARDLTLAQAALVAGLPQAPSGGDPFLAPERALRRRNEVLDAMLEAGRSDGGPAIDRATWLAARRSPLGLAAGGGLPPAAPAAVAVTVRAELAAAGSAATSVRTALDPVLEARAVSAVASLEAAHPGARASLLAVRPGSGAIVAVAGIARPDDLAVAYPLGGLAKPIVAAAAAGLAIAVPSTWRGRSIDAENAVYGALARRVGPSAAVRMARLVGVQGTPLAPDPSFAAGAQGAGLVEMATAFSTLATGGVRPAVRLVLDGAVSDRGPVRVLSPAVAAAARASLVPGPGGSGRTAIAPGLATAWRCTADPALVVCVVVDGGGAPLGATAAAAAALPDAVVAAVAP